MITEDLDRASSLPYRPCVGIMLLNHAGKVFVGQRSSKPEHHNVFDWQMPQGGLDEGEEAYACAQRELYEETNVQNTSLLAEHPQWLSYDLPPELIGQAWKGKYRGQTQKWFMLRFDGAEDEINVTAPANGQFKPEFTAWRWMNVAELPSLIVPFKRPVYETLVQWHEDVHARAMGA